MTKEELVRLLQQGKATWNEWREKNRTSFVDLGGVDLSNAMLRGVDLSEADLSNAVATIPWCVTQFCWNIRTIQGDIIAFCTPGEPK